MKRKQLISILVLTFAVCVSVPQKVRAGGAAPTAPTGATLRGSVRFEGKMPAARVISMSADPSCAKQHSSPVLTQDVMVDAKGDLQNVVVFISEGLGDRTFDAPSQAVVVEQKGCLYQPHVLAVRANQPLDLVNDDPTSHNIHPQPANNREWNKAEPPGSKIEEAFAREEIAIPVKCNVHPWMRGYIAVFKHPYFAVTGKDGGFDLSHLPAGTYTIEAWHEKLGTSSQTVTIGENETKEIKFVFKTM
jgi:plastocyanin